MNGVLRLAGFVVSFSYVLALVYHLIVILFIPSHTIEIGEPNPFVLLFEVCLGFFSFAFLIYSLVEEIVVEV